MADESSMTPGKRKFQILVGVGGACVVSGFLLAFTIIGLPVGIPVIVVGVVLLAISPFFKAKHLVRSYEERDKNN